MRKINLAILFSFVSLIGFAQSLKVVIKQNGKIIQPVNNIYELKKSTFAFEITSTGLEGFLIGATTDESIYNAALGDYNPDVWWFQNTGMAEELYNADKELFLMDLAPSYWYYTDSKDHRFDKNPKGNLNQWKGTRTISKFYDIIAVEEIALKNFEGSVYMLMYNPIYNDEYDLVEKENLFNATLKFKD